MGSKQPRVSTEQCRLYTARGMGHKLGPGIARHNLESFPVDHEIRLGEDSTPALHIGTSSGIGIDFPLETQTYATMIVSDTF